MKIPTPKITLKMKVNPPSADDILPKFSLGPVANRLMSGMQEHWSKSLDSGSKPDGTPLPHTKKGEPMGLGNGTFVRAIREKNPNAKKSKQRANVMRTKLALSSLDKRHAVAWNDLHKHKDMEFRDRGFAGEAEQQFNSLVDKEFLKLAKKIASAMRRKAKGKRPDPIEG